jgi:REP element-mobilizing transposase RayT
LSDHCKEQFRKLLWQQAAFSGIEVISYRMMTDHFHVLVRTPENPNVTDQAILKRLQLRYGTSNTFVSELENSLTKGGTIDRQTRNRFLSRMGDVSVFTKELKQRFTHWYNTKNNRFGTLWAERFTRVCSKKDQRSQSQMAANVTRAKNPEASFSNPIADGTLFLDALEEVFDLMPTLVVPFVIGCGIGSIGLGRNAGLESPLRKQGSKTIGVVGFVRQNGSPRVARD